MSTVRAIRWPIVAPVLFVIGSAVVFLTIGIPYERDSLAVWLLVGLGCFSVTDMRGYFQGLVRDWLPFFAILTAYDALRGVAGHLAPVHYVPQIQADRALFGGDVPTVWLQRHLWNGHVRWIDFACWGVYMTHFFFVPLLAAVLWKLDRDRFRMFTGTVILLSFAALATYAVYPAAPPWMASEAHMIPPITRILPSVWLALPVKGLGSAVEHGYSFANSVAAVPSVHAAFSMIVSVTLWPYARRWLRPLLVAYPLGMAFAIVYTGEHYVSDVILGWMYAGGCVVAVRALAQWRASRVQTAALPQSAAG